MADQFTGVAQPGAVSPRQYRPGNEGKPDPGKGVGLLSATPIGPGPAGPYLPRGAVKRSDGPNRGK
jgi:hypothetical protein